MGQKQKLIERFCNMPKDFTYDELKSLLKIFHYEVDESGDGSRVKFFNKTNNDIIMLHKPHPGNIIKSYIMKNVYKKLKEAGYIE